MCSSGRSSPYPRRPIGDLAGHSERETERREFEVELEGTLADLLSEFNERDVEQLNKHLDTIQQAIHDDLEGSVDLLFGGSVSKHTYVDGLSDVDMLVCLNDTSLEAGGPDAARNALGAILRQRLPKTTITTGDMSLTLTFSDGTAIQLLPAIKTPQGCRLPQPGKGGWSHVIRPDAFARKLTKVNQDCANKVVPVIKLAKAMNAALPKPQRLTGYHIESIAIEAFEHYDGRETYQEMVRHFWRRAQSLVLKPIADRTGQSLHVDDYLGAAQSDARRRVSAAAIRVGSRIDNANASLSLDDWQELIV